MKKIIEMFNYWGKTGHGVSATKLLKQQIPGGFRGLLNTGW